MGKKQQTIVLKKPLFKGVCGHEVQIVRLAKIKGHDQFTWYCIRCEKVMRRE